MDLNELSLDNIGAWPFGARMAAAVIVLVGVMGAGYYFFTQDKIALLEKAQQKEEPLKQEFKTKQGKAANLQAYKEQMVEMEKRFGSMLRQLPEKTEVADLLVEISQTGLSNNLEFSLFQPLEEVKKEFYAELPVNINVTGTYHDFGEFATGIAALPRIVTVHDIEMAPLDLPKEKNDKGKLVTVEEDLDADKKLTITLIAKTYRYLDDEEQESASQGKKKKRRNQKK